MSTSTPPIRKRKGGGFTSPISPKISADGEERKIHGKRGNWWTKQSEQQQWRFILIAFTVASFISRFWRIWNPAEVVFDEVHFGKFASYYLRRTYFFDVHPPLGKMLIALIGWLGGYDGHFDFDNIGDDYIKNNVPYVWLRSWSAILGTLMVPIVVDFAKQLGYSQAASVLVGCMILFDNALVTQTRLILLDAMLIFNCIVAAYCWVRFYNLRYSPFTKAWWGWMIACGVMLAAALGIKMVGLFTVALVGVATLFELWNLLDWKRGMSTNLFMWHFMARSFGLIFVPIFFYLFWFWCHFAILTYSGPGDAFMSHRFQSELKGSSAVGNSVPIMYYGNVTFRHRDTSVLLHSHPDRYPLRYEDNRVSSAGQQVTGYPHKDANNKWILEPADPELYPGATPWHQEDLETGIRYLRNGDIVRLLHYMTNSHLITHDVASTLMPTHMEMTTHPVDEDPKRYEETLWRVDVDTLPKGQRVSSVGHYLKLINIHHKVAVHSHPGALPSWAFSQQEVNGNKAIGDRANQWFVEDVEPPEEELIEEHKVRGGGLFVNAQEVVEEEMEVDDEIDEDNPMEAGPAIPAQATEMKVATQEAVPVVQDEKLDPLDVPLRSTISIKNILTNAWLHSHKDRYPQNYEDGRISSAGQQVTGYTHREDPNNHWSLEAVDPPYPGAPGWTKVDVERKRRYLRDGDFVRLYHAMTDSYLLTHDVASPSMPTNMEITTVPKSDTKRKQETVWRVEIIPSQEVGGRPVAWKSTRQAIKKDGKTRIRFVNVYHKVALFSPGKPLPKWGFNQLELNGNKEVQEAGGNVWVVDEVWPVAGGEEEVVGPAEETQIAHVNRPPQKIQVKRRSADIPKTQAKKLPRLSFFSKFWELQTAMLRHNAGLTKPHPYQSDPTKWPTLVRGISFWERKGPPTWRQIYLLGNPLVWWFKCLGIVTFFAVFVMDQLLLRRGLDSTGGVIRRWYTRSVGYVALGWVLHYVPFFIMGRSLFLHHYLPALVFGCLTTAGVLEYLVNVFGRGFSKIYGTDGVVPSEEVMKEEWNDGLALQQQRWKRWKSTRTMWTLSLGLSVIFLWCFWYFAFATYGDEMTDPKPIRNRRWISTWDFQFSEPDV